MRYRRPRLERGTFFFTVVTHDRRPFLCEPKNITLLRESFCKVMAAHPFTIDAIVILPDHLHAIWTLPDGETGLFRTLAGYQIPLHTRAACLWDSVDP